MGSYLGEGGDLSQIRGRGNMGKGRGQVFFLLFCRLAQKEEKNLLWLHLLKKTARPQKLEKKKKTISKRSWGIYMMITYPPPPPLIRKTKTKTKRRR